MVRRTRPRILPKKKNPAPELLGTGHATDTKENTHRGFTGQVTLTYTINVYE